MGTMGTMGGTMARVLKESPVFGASPIEVIDTLVWCRGYPVPVNLSNATLNTQFPGQESV
jgi:hypothetical protein